MGNQELQVPAGRARLGFTKRSQVAVPARFPATRLRREAGRRGSASLGVSRGQLAGGRRKARAYQAGRAAPRVEREGTGVDTPGTGLCSGCAAALGAGRDSLMTLSPGPGARPRDSHCPAPPAVTSPAWHTSGLSCGPSTSVLQASEWAELEEGRRWLTQTPSPPGGPVSSEAEAAGAGGWSGEEQGAMHLSWPSTPPCDVPQTAAYLQHLAGPWASGSHSRYVLTAASVCGEQPLDRTPRTALSQG